MRNRFCVDRAHAHIYLNSLASLKSITTITTIHKIDTHISFFFSVYIYSFIYLSITNLQTHCGRVSVFVCVYLWFHSNEIKTHIMFVSLRHNFVCFHGKYCDLCVILFLDICATNDDINGTTRMNRLIVCHST